MFLCELRSTVQAYSYLMKYCEFCMKPDTAMEFTHSTEFKTHMGSGVLWLMGVPGYFDVGHTKLMYSLQSHSPVVGCVS